MADSHFYWLLQPPDLQTSRACISEEEIDNGVEHSALIRLFQHESKTCDLLQRITSWLPFSEPYRALARTCKTMRALLHAPSYLAMLTSLELPPHTRITFFGSFQSHMEYTPTTKKIVGFMRRQSQLITETKQSAPRKSDLELVGLLGKMESNIHRTAPLAVCLQQLPSLRCVHVEIHNEMVWNEEVDSIGKCLGVLQRCCPWVIDLRLHHPVVSWTDNELKALCNAYPKLQRLDLYRNGDVTEEGILASIRLLKSLESLNLGYIAAVTDEVFGALLQLPSLVELDLTGCVGIRHGIAQSGDSDDEGSTLEKKESGGSCCVASSLHTLSLNSCSNVSGIFMGSLMQWVPNLTYLDLSWCPFATEALTAMRGRSDRLEVKLSATAPRRLALRSLLLSDCKDLSAAFLASFFGLVQLPDLCELSLSHVSTVDDVVLGSIAKGERSQRTKPLRLRELNLGECGLIRDGGLYDLLSASGATIVSLTLTGCSRLTDNAMEAVAHTGQNLEWLSVEGCSLISNKGLRLIADKCKSLRRLQIGGCVLVSDAGLAAIARGCRGLEHLDISNCELVSDAGIINVGTYCNRLHEFLAENCAALTDKSMMAISIGCKKLSLLHVGNCRLLSDQGLMWLGKHCKRLKTLDISNCSRVSEAGLKTLLIATQLQYVNVGYASSITAEFIFAMEKLHATSNLKLKIEKSGV